MAVRAGRFPPWRWPGFFPLLMGGSDVWIGFDLPVNLHSLHKRAVSCETDKENDSKPATALGQLRKVCDAALETLFDPT